MVRVPLVVRLCTTIIELLDGTHPVGNCVDVRHVLFKEERDIVKFVYVMCCGGTKNVLNA